MESLSTVGEILLQLKQLLNGMASVCEDINVLKRKSSLQHNDSECQGDTDYTTERVVVPSFKADLKKRLTLTCICIYMHL